MQNKQIESIPNNRSSYLQMEAVANIEKQNKEKLDSLKSRIKKFETVSTLEEAKELMAKVIPVAKEKTTFQIGYTKCVIINREDNLRISIDSPEEFIAYDFQK